MDWCLRGEADVSKFRDFTVRDGELFVSGDYESAADNISVDVARHILTSIGRRCTRVPLGIREAALRTLDCQGEYLGALYPLRRQLMGNSMSFPLLCLQNYLTFKFLVPRQVPVRINGDDIVFRSTRSEFEVWADGVHHSGLVLSRGKTAVESRWFSLNSTFFVAGTRRVKLAPVVRSTCLFKSASDAGAVGGKLKSFRGFSPSRRQRLEIFVLRRFSAPIWQSQRSLRRGLGFRLSDRSVLGAGLWSREVFYTSLPSRADPPLQEARVGYLRYPVPEGWRRVRSHDPVDTSVQQEFFRTLVERAWSDPPSRVSECVDLTFRYQAFPGNRRLVGMGKAAYRRWVRGTCPRKFSEGVSRWVRTDVVPEFARPVLFTRCGWA